MISGSGKHVWKRALNVSFQKGHDSGYIIHLRDAVMRVRTISRHKAQACEAGELLKMTKDVRTQQCSGIIKKTIRCTEKGTINAVTENSEHSSMIIPAWSNMLSLSHTRTYTRTYTHSHTPFCYSWTLCFGRSKSQTLHKMQNCRNTSRTTHITLTHSQL